MKPYTYLIKHIPTQKYYYGVSYGLKSDPKEFWVRYFTSSKKVKELISIYGKDSFEYEIRKIFNNQEEAQNWEKTVLRRMKVHLREDFLNINPGRGYGYPGIGNKHASYGKKYSEEHRRKNSEGQKLSPSWGKTPENHPSRIKLSELAKERFLGKKQSKEHIEKRKLFGEKNPMFGKTFSEDTLNKISIRSKNYAKNKGELHEGTINLRKSYKERIANGTHPSQIITKCPHCNKEVKSLGNYKRWHGDKCKLKEQ